MTKQIVKSTRKDIEGFDDEVKELVSPYIITPEVLDAISVTLCAKRDEAKAGRSGSNIESTWTACEEAYLGIDDANRMEMSASRWMKPMSMEGPVTTGRIADTDDAKSTVYVRLTSRYVDAGAAKLSEILLPIDDKAFSINEMPDPTLIKAKGNKSQVFHDGMDNAPLTRPAMPGEAPSAPSPGMGSVIPFPGNPGAGAPNPQQRVPLTVSDLAEENIKLARVSAKSAEKRIHGWMISAMYAAEVRKQIFDSARLGVGVLKGPFAQVKRHIAVSKGTNGVQVNVINKITPSCKWIKAWNLFPDPSCGENIHDGDYLFERDHLTDKQLRDLKKAPGYIAEQIDKCIELGPKQLADAKNADPATREKARKESRYEIWYFYGTLTREEVSCIYEASGKELKSNKKSIYAIVTIVDDTIVRATINPLDTGSFPYHTMPWQRRSGSWAGVGICEQMTSPQAIINGATRAMMDNAGIAAGPQVVMDTSCVEPADGRWGVTPNKLWYMKRGKAASPNGVKDAFAIFEMPNTTDPLMKVVEYAWKLAEESTSIPLITQGQTGPTTPETLGATQIQDSNANQLLRSIGYSFDDHVTEPLVKQYYEWLLLDPDVPDDEKGEFEIEAHGSAALVEQAIQDATIAQMGEMVLNPNYELSPAKWAKMMLRSKRINPDDLRYTDDELKAMKAQPPPQAPAVEVANIKAKVDMEKLASSQTADQRSSQNEASITQAAHALEGARVEAEDRRTLSDSTIRLHELNTQRDIAIMDHANKRNISFSDAQTEIMKEAMKLSTALHMNAADRIHDMKKHTMTIEAAPAQTPGRAADGQAFEQGQ